MHNQGKSACQKIILRKHIENTQNKSQYQEIANEVRRKRESMPTQSIGATEAEEQKTLEIGIQLNLFDHLAIT